MAQPAVINGEKILIQIGDGGSPEVFTHPCMINGNRGISFTGDVQQDDIPDCANPGDAAWKATNVTSLVCEISGEGMLDAAAVGYYTDWLVSAQPKNVKAKINLSGSAIYSGSFVITKFDVTGNRKQKATASMTLVSDGPVTRTTVP